MINKKSFDKEYSTGVFKKYTHEYDDDMMIEIEKIFDYATNSKPATVSKSDYNKAVQAKIEAESKAKAVMDTIHSVTEGNVAMQRQLIQIDPHNIQYIKNPYVDIQLEAIMADSTCFPRINNPSQEAIDMYRLVK